MSLSKTTSFTSTKGVCRTNCLIKTLDKKLQENLSKRKRVQSIQILALIFVIGFGYLIIQIKLLLIDMQNIPLNFASLLSVNHQNLLRVSFFFRHSASVVPTVKSCMSMTCRVCIVYQC